MTDPEVQAAMKVLSDLTPAAYLTDFRLSCLQACCMVKMSLQYGTSALARPPVPIGGLFSAYISPFTATPPWAVRRHAKWDVATCAFSSRFNQQYDAAIELVRDIEQMPRRGYPASCSPAALGQSQVCLRTLRPPG